MYFPLSFSFNNHLFLFARPVSSYSKLKSTSSTHQILFDAVSIPFSSPTFFARHRCRFEIPCRTKNASSQTSVLDDSTTPPSRALRPRRNPHSQATHPNLYRVRNKLLAKNAGVTRGQPPNQILQGCQGSRERPSLASCFSFLLESPRHTDNLECVSSYGMTLVVERSGSFEAPLHVKGWTQVNIGRAVRE